MKTLLSVRMWGLPCRYCGAAPGYACRTKAGRLCRMHSARFWDAKAQEATE